MLQLKTLLLGTSFCLVFNLGYAQEVKNISNKRKNDYFTINEKFSVLKDKPERQSEGGKLFSFYKKNSFIYIPPKLLRLVCKDPVQLYRHSCCSAVQSLYGHLGKAKKRS
ncbi:hypothetical protein SAMN04488524_0463 [Pedobacter africanus]|uniref:Uncharacterized protein n=1 Tax=Pedobacter africanus TaxID=151894 RepID=A0A1W1Z845_9SPHI|nr:hypothetical protein SAMN04488524_0463 [Pedobacter africanus]